MLFNHFFNHISFLLTFNESDKCFNRHLFVSKNIRQANALFIINEFQPENSSATIAFCRLKKNSFQRTGRQKSCKIPGSAKGPSVYILPEFTMV